MGILIMAYYNPHYNWVYLIPLIKGSLDEKLPSYELLKMLKIQ